MKRKNFLLGFVPVLLGGFIHPLGGIVTTIIVSGFFVWKNK